MPVSDLSAVKVGDLVCVSSIGTAGESFYVTPVTHVLPSIHIANHTCPFDPVTGREFRKGAARLQISIATPEQIVADGARRERYYLGSKIRQWLSRAEKDESPIPIEDVRAIVAMLGEV